MTALIPPALTVHPTSTYADPTPLPLVRVTAVSNPADGVVRTARGSNPPRRRRWMHALLHH